MIQTNWGENGYALGFRVGLFCLYMNVFIPINNMLLGIQDWKTHLLCPFWRIGMAVLK